MATKRAKLVWKGPQVLKVIQVGTEKGIKRAADLVVKEALRLILQTAKSGRFYGAHQASAPGEAPASQFGQLVAGFRIEIRGHKAVISNIAPHAPKLERGTQRMAARPFMAPAIANTSRKAFDAIANSIKRETGYGSSSKK